MLYSHIDFTGHDLLNISIMHLSTTFEMLPCVIATKTYLLLSHKKSQKNRKIYKGHI